MKELMDAILGPSGRICSGSKSIGPAMAIYNSNMVFWQEKEDPDIVWYGDLVLDETMVKILTRLADQLKLEIMVFYESPLRQFAINEEDYSKAREFQKGLIKNRSGLVWTSREPTMFANMPYEEAKQKNKARREKARTMRAAYVGMLTPVGTEWRCYNKWFYKGPYRVYVYLKRWVVNFLVWPFKAAFLWKLKLKWYQRISLFFKSVAKEFYYQRFERGLLHIGFLKLNDKTTKS